MRFYTKQHQFYCGIDLHARTMFVCILDQSGKICLEKNLHSCPDKFLTTIEPFRSDIVICVECLFTWYWLADLCSEQGIPFVLGHALYMNAIHGGKAKNDRIDAHKIAVLLRGGMIPQAYVYPPGMRSTRDVMRRRLYVVRKRGQLLAHIQNTNHQYNLPDITAKLAYKANREGFVDRFEDPSVGKSMEIDLELVAHFDQIIRDLELFIVRKAKQHDADMFHRLRSIPGIGKVLALTILMDKFLAS